jgi:hypothetical protein
MASWRAGVSVLALVAGCGGGSGGKAAPADAAGAVVDAAAADATGDAAAVPVPTDAGPDLPPLAPASLRLLMPGKPRLTGTGASTCSSGPRSAESGTWCAFAKTIDAGDGGQISELWVINMTRMIAGENVPCDGSSPHCRRMHANVWTGGALGGPFYPYDDHFDGDTLIFYAGGVSTKPDGLYQGPIWAWRPGWAEPRVISSDKGLMCFGHPSADVAYCVENVFQGPVQFDLRAGTLVDGPNNLPLLATGVRPWKGNEIAWHAEFSPDGKHFAISVQEPSTEGEVLHIGATADLGKVALKELAYNATYWRISLDGKKIYYLQGFASEPQPGGALMMADFPEGTNRVQLHPKVAEYQLLGEPGTVDRGLGLYVDRSMGASTFRVMADRTRPLELVTVAEKVDDVFVSPDGRYGLFIQVDEATGFEKIKMASTDGKESCTLNALPESEVFSMHFLDDSSMVFWSEINPSIDDGVGQGWLARTAGCTGKQKYADKVDFITTLKDRVAIVAHTPKDDVWYALEHARIGTGAMPLSMPVPIRAGADLILAPISDQRSTHLLFQVPDGPPEMQGIYLYGPIAH